VIKMVKAKKTQLEYKRRAKFSRPSIIGVRKLVCSNHNVHNVSVITYDDGSVFVACPLFGWYTDNKGAIGYGCVPRKKRCTWYISTH